MKPQLKIDKKNTSVTTLICLFIKKSATEHTHFCFDVQVKNENGIKRMNKKRTTTTKTKIDETLLKKSFEQKFG